MIDNSNNTISSQNTSKTNISSKNPVKKIRLKRFFSCHTSISNDSNENNKTQNSFREYNRKSTFDIEYPVFTKSHSVKKFDLNSSLIQRIKEELNEDDSFSSNYKRRKNFSRTVMPKDNLLFFDKKKYDEPLNISSKMEVVPEIIEDNFFFESPRIPMLIDLKEDSKLKNNKNINLIKTPVNENDIIKEENEDYFDLKYNFKGDSIAQKFENFIDKEEPPLDFKNLQGECRTFYDFDVITEANNEEDVHIDAKEIMRKNSFNLRKLGNMVCIDEIDSHPKIKTIKNNIDISDPVIHEDEENNDKVEEEEPNEEEQNNNDNNENEVNEVNEVNEEHKENEDNEDKNDN